MPELNKLEEFGDSLKQYLLLNIKILKLEATNQISSISSSVISSLVVGISAFLFVFILSLGLCFYLSALIGDTYSGFAIIAACYLLLFIILFVARKKILEHPLRDKMVKKLLEDKEK
jgi:O-antigen/teichoic acid export membrane protein